MAKALAEVQETNDGAALKDARSPVNSKVEERLADLRAAQEMFDAAARNRLAAQLGPQAGLSYVESLSVADVVERLADLCADAIRYSIVASVFDGEVFGSSSGSAFEFKLLAIGMAKLAGSIAMEKYKLKEGGADGEPVYPF